MNSSRSIDRERAKYSVGRCVFVLNEQTNEKSGEKEEKEGRGTGRSEKQWEEREVGGQKRGTVEEAALKRKKGMILWVGEIYPSLFLPNTIALVHCTSSSGNAVRRMGIGLFSPRTRVARSHAVTRRSSNGMAALLINSCALGGARAPPDQHRIPSGASERWQHNGFSLYGETGRGGRLPLFITRRLNGGMAGARE